MIRSFYRELPGSSDNGTRRKIFLVRAAVSVAILGLLLWWLPTEVLFAAMASVPLAVWGMVIAGFILGHLFSSLKWRMLLAAAGVKISVQEAIRAHSAGLFANLFLPSLVGGDMVRAAIVIRDHKPVEGVALGSLADRINDTFALLLLATLAGFFIPDVQEIATAQILVGAAIMLLAAVLLVSALIRWVPVSRLPPGIRKFMLRVRDAQNSLLRSPGVALTALMMSFSIQGGFVLLNVLLAQAIGIAAPLSLWFFAWPMAKLIALAPVSLGGIGVREVAIAGLMAPFGFEPAMIVAQSLSWEVVLVTSGLLAGFTATLLPAKRRKMKAADRD